MSILIKDNQTGHIHEYGTNGHDSLHISGDGSCLHYENLQNGDGSMGGGYSFVEEDGKIPSESETADAIRAMCYFNIGGFRTEVEARPQGECENCDFRKFSETFIDGVVEVMNKNGITSLEQLSEILKGGAE